MATAGLRLGAAQNAELAIAKDAIVPTRLLLLIQEPTVVGRGSTGAAVHSAKVVDLPNTLTVDVADDIIAAQTAQVVTAGVATLVVIVVGMVMMLKLVMFVTVMNTVVTVEVMLTSTGIIVVVVVAVE
ncbi:hypothetical protein AB5N19_03405 [Seiridium cardinale]